MKKNKLILLLMICFLFLGLQTQAKEKSKTNIKEKIFSILTRKEYVFIMPYSQGNKLYFEYTYDGLRWENIDNSFFSTKNGIINSPSISQNKEDVFHLLWTDGKNIYHSTSKDLIKWSIGKKLDIRNNKNIKSVQLYNKRNSKEFKIIWSAENDNKNVIYSASTKDFSKLSDESILCKQDFSLIDPFIINSKNYNLFFANENASSDNSNIFTTSSRSFKKLGLKEIIPLPAKGNIKNPTAIKIRDYIYVYWNDYTKKNITSLRCQDLSKPIWTNVTKYSSFSKTINVNSIFKIESDILYNIQKIANKNL